MTHRSLASTQSIQSVWDQSPDQSGRKHERVYIIAWRPGMALLQD